MSSEMPTKAQADFKMPLMGVARWDGRVPGFPMLPRCVVFTATSREAAERRAQHNHRQTLTRLRERGGVDLTEAMCLLEDRRWEQMTPEEMADGLRRHADVFTHGPVTP